jgi:hypothetical protein
MEVSPLGQGPENSGMNVLLLWNVGNFPISFLTNPFRVAAIVYTCIGKVLGSNPSQTTDSAEISYGFAQ